MSLDDGAHGEGVADDLLEPDRAVRARVPPQPGPGFVPHGLAIGVGDLLRLKDGTLIQLPAIDEEAALIRLDGLEQSQRILDLGLARIDLRNSEFLAVRPRDAVQSAGGV